MMQHRSRSGRRSLPRRRFARGVVLVGAAFVLTSCVSMPEERSAEGRAWVPATQERAVAFLDRFDDVLAEAGAERDAEMAAEVVDGPFAERRTAQYQIAAHRDPHMEEPEPVVRHQDPTILIPESEEYPAWFLAVTDPRTDEGEGEPEEDEAEEDEAEEDEAEEDEAEEHRHLGVVRRADASAPWKKVALVTVPVEELPQFDTAGDDLVQAVAADDDEGLAISPQQLVAALAAALADPDSDALEHLEMNDVIENQQANDDPGDDPLTISSTYTPESAPYAIRTDDGGALVVASFLQEQEVRLAGGGRVEAGAGSALEALADGKTVTRELLTIETMHDVATYLPAEGDGKATVLAISSTNVAADFR